MSNIESPDRYCCTIGGKRMIWAKLERRYVCNDCGGRIAHKFEFDQETGQTVDSARCGQCGGGDFISESAYLRQIYDSHRITENLPPELAELVGREQRNEPQQAGSDLYEF